MKIYIENLKYEKPVFRTPFKFGKAVIKDLSVPVIKMRLSESGDESTGIGSMTLGNAWSFPNAGYSESLDFMEKLVNRLAKKFNDIEINGSILPISEQLKEISNKQSDELAKEIEHLPKPVPRLCSLVCFSLFDIALFDAWGKLNRMNSFSLIRRRPEGTYLEPWLGESYKDFSLNQVILPNPSRHLFIYHVVGGLDPLSKDEVNQTVNDGYPEHLQEWITRDQLTHFKIKMRGDDPEWDYQRLISIDKICSESVRGEPVYSLDFNEKCPSGQALLDFCYKMQKDNPQIFQRIEFLEQPTSRELLGRPEDDVREVARLKPVVMDESLVDYPAYLKAKELGYNGIALKGCKGIGFSLLMAIVAKKDNLFLTVMDLTCPGISFLASASLAAWVGVTGIEANARQFCPTANEVTAKSRPEVFQIKEGKIQTDKFNSAGLGYSLDPIDTKQVPPN